MAPNKETGKPIPDKWDGQNYTTIMLCCPDDVEWIGYVKGAIYELTRGRDWDANTGIITEAQAIAQEIYESMSQCDDLVKTNRMIAAALTGEIVDLTNPAEVVPDFVDYSLTGVVPNLNKYLIHLETLGEIPGSGDTIQRSLQHLVDVSGWTDETIDDLIAKIQALDPGLLDTFGDLANILIAYKSLFPGTTNVHIVKPFYEKWTAKRFEHNLLSLHAYQATALRGIQRSLAPFDDAPTEDNEKKLIDDIFSIPFLSKAVVAILEPSPLGEATIIGSYLPEIVKNTFSVITSAWDRWWNKWVNRVTTPVPVDTVTGNLSAIADAIAGIQPTTQEEADGADLPGAINDLSTIIATHGLAITAALIAQEHIVNVTCSQCGSSGGCGCGAGGDIPDPGADGPFQPGETVGQPAGGSGPGGGGVPPGYEGGSPDFTAAYSSYKCSAANFVFDSVFNGLTYLGGISSAAGAISAGQAVGAWLLSVMVASSSFSTVLGGAIVWSMVAGWEIALFISLIAGVTALAGYSVLELFGTLANKLLEEKADTVCGLYEAQTVSEAKTVMSDALTTAITGFAIPAPYDAYDSLIRSTWSSVIGTFIPTTLFNKLFDEDFNVTGYPANEMCCSCEAIIIQTGTLTGTDTYQAEYEPASSSYFLRLLWNVNEASPDVFSICGPNITIDSISNFSPVGNNGYRASSSLNGGSSCSGWDVYCSSVYPTEFPYVGVRALTLRSDNDFSVTVTTSEI